LLAQPSIFSPEGEVAAKYMRTGDLRLLDGISSWTLEAIQEVRRRSGYVVGQGPGRVRFLESDIGGQEREAGSIALVPKAEVKRHLARSKQPKDDRVLPMPRRVTGRRMPVDLRPKPSGYIVKMENTTGVDMRLELVNPAKIDFADFFSWSVDFMFSSESTSQDGGGGPDFHTSIPEHGGSSWYVTMGFRNAAPDPWLFAFWKNKNTDEIEYQWLMNPKYDRWYNFRMEIVTSVRDSSLADDELRLDFYIDGRHVWSTIPPDTDILLDPSRLAFGPIRSFACTMFDEGKSVLYIDNVKAAYPTTE
jgi:hypothetical protein